MGVITTMAKLLVMITMVEEVVVVVATIKVVVVVVIMTMTEVATGSRDGVAIVAAIEM